MSEACRYCGGAGFTIEASGPNAPDAHDVRCSCQCACGGLGYITLGLTPILTTEGVEYLDLRGPCPDCATPYDGGLEPYDGDYDGDYGEAF